MNESKRGKQSGSVNNFSAQLRNWEEVNQCLAYLGEVERQIRARQDEFQRQVAVLKQEWFVASQPIERERERLRYQMERFYWGHRDELLATGRKSLELSFGRLGSRRSHSLIVEDAEAARQWLSAHGLRRFLRTRTEMDREAIRSVLLTANGPGDEETAALLACPVLRLRESEQFWYEVNLPGGSLGNRTETPAETSNYRGETEKRTMACSHERVSFGGSHEQTVQQTL